ncbi:hypothetical protein SDC9_115380 [bioreactor metagenome]|uniref:Uncharacterized protein n=1 Tax=bioreactor metagenome TaxID=1076179 RepID=A0A645BTA4_9ZZZZ
MQMLYGPPRRDHGGDGTRNVGHKLMVNLSDHGNPKRAAAAGQLKILLGLDVPVEFQRFLQRKHVGKESHLHHALKAQGLKGGAKLSGRDRIGKLAQKGGGDQGVHRSLGALHRIQRGENVSAGGERAGAAGIDTGRASSAFNRVYDHLALLVAGDGLKEAGGGAGRLPLPAGAVSGAPDGRMSVGMEQTVQLMLIGSREAWGRGLPIQGGFKQGVV